MILQEAAQIVSSRPLAVGSAPKDLLVGRARAGMPTVHLETGQQLVKRFKAVQQPKEEFWDRWVKEIFPSLLKQRKWYKYKRDARIGDVVLRKDKTAAGQTYKYARIIGVHVGSDGKVRSADVEYKVTGKSKFHVTTRLIHKLVMVVPMEEQLMEDPENLEDEQRSRKEEINIQEGPGGDNIGEVVREKEPEPENPAKTAPALQYLVRMCLPKKTRRGC